LEKAFAVASPMPELAPVIAMSGLDMNYPPKSAVELNDGL
jgi:hypothetical protein